MNGQLLPVRQCGDKELTPPLLLRCLDKLAHSLSISQVAGQGRTETELGLLGRVVKAFKGQTFNPQQLRRLPAASRIGLMRRVKTSMHTLERSLPFTHSLTH